MYKRTESTAKAASIKLAAGHSSVCPQCGDQQKENDLFDRLSGLLLMSGFETSLIQIMMSDMYCRDKKASAKYENLRNMVAMKAQEQFGEIQAGKNLNSQETIRTLNNRLESFASEVHVLNQEKTKLQQEIKYLQEELVTADNKASMAIEGVKHKCDRGRFDNSTNNI